MDYEEILAGMQAKYRELTGFDADCASDIGIRLRVLADGMSGLFAGVEALERQMFPQTATGEALERHAACRGLARKPARPAGGMLRFARQTAPAADIPIAQGVICATRTDPPIRYETAEAGVLPAGRCEADIAIRAIDLGSAGNVGPGAVCMMVTAVSGISAVHNPAPLGGGVNEEDDEQLRARLLRAYREISNGTNAAFYHDLVMANEKVQSAQVIPRRRGRGTVDVAFVCESVDDESGVRAELQDELERRREVNVDVSVYAAARQGVDVEVEIAPADGYSREEVGRALTRRIMQYVDALGVGQPLYRAGLYAFVMGAEGVRNAAVKRPAQDVEPAVGGVVRARSCSVTGMGE